MLPLLSLLLAAIADSVTGNEARVQTLESALGIYPYHEPSLEFLLGEQTIFEVCRWENGMRASRVVGVRERNFFLKISALNYEEGHEVYLFSKHAVLNEKSPMGALAGLIVVKDKRLLKASLSGDVPKYEFASMVWWFVWEVFGKDAFRFATSRKALHDIGGPIIVNQVTWDVLWEEGRKVAAAFDVLQESISEVVASVSEEAPQIEIWRRINYDFRIGGSHPDWTMLEAFNSAFASQIGQVLDKCGVRGGGLNTRSGEEAGGFEFGEHNYLVRLSVDPLKSPVRVLWVEADRFSREQTRRLLPSVRNPMEILDGSADGIVRMVSASQYDRDTVPSMTGAFLFPPSVVQMSDADFLAAMSEGSE